MNNIFVDHLPRGKNLENQTRGVLGQSSEIAIAVDNNSLEEQKKPDEKDTLCVDLAKASIEPQAEKGILALKQTKEMLGVHGHVGGRGRGIIPERCAPHVPFQLGQSSEIAIAVGNNSLEEQKKPEEKDTLCVNLARASKELQADEGILALKQTKEMLGVHGHVGGRGRGIIPERCAPHVPFQLGQSSEIAIAVGNNSLEEQKKPEEKDTLCVNLARASKELQADEGILALKQTKEMLGVHGHVGGRGRGIIPERCAPHVPFQLGQSSEIAIAVGNNSLEEQKKPEEKDTLCVNLARASKELQADEGILALKQTKEMLGVHGHVGGRGRGIIPERCAPHVPFQLGQSSEIAIAVGNNSLEEQKKPEEKDTLCVNLARASKELQADEGILALKQTKEMLGVHGHVGGRGRGIIPERCAPHVPFQLGPSLELATQSIANEEPQQFAVINNSLEEENKQEENDTFCEDLARASVEPRAVDDIMALKAAVHHRGRGRGRGKIADCSTQRVLQLGQSLQLAISPVAIEQQLKAHLQLKRMNVSQQAAGSAALKERSPPREVASLKLKLAKSTTNGGAVATRALDSTSKQGTVGERIRLHSNYYRVLKRPDWTINQYHVDFEPDIDNTRMRRIYLNGLRDQIGAFIFDGQVLYCARHLSKNELQLETFDHNNEKILVKLRYTNIVEIMDGHQYQFLNLLLRRALEGLNLQLISRNYFDPQAKINIEKLRMELWPGYITSVHQHEKETLLCVEITHKVMRTETLLDIYGKCRKNQEDFKNEVKGTVVLTDYNNKTYRIDGVDFLSTPRSTFDTKDGDISYIDYYAKRYGIKIRVDEQPLLVSKVKDKRNNAQLSVMLIPELCRATGITDAMRANKRLMREMNEHTHMVPKRRIQWLQNFNKRLLSTAQSADLLKAWGIDLDTELIELPARILPSQTILLKNRSYTCDSKVDWTRELRHGMYSSVRMKNWCVINQQRRRREAQNFIDLCIDAAAEMGMTIAKPAYYEIGDDKEYTIGTNIKKAVMMDPQIIMFILEQAHEAKYSHFKKLTCVEHPVPSQVVTLSKIMPRKNFGSTATARTIAAKVVIQMNAKLGGVPWLIKIPIKGLMSIGFDVGHSPKNKDRSYGAFVASLETEKSSKFFSIVHELSKGQELCDKMRLSIIRALEAYKQHNGALPEKIVFYRDGVSEGQEDQVLRTELQNFKDGMMEIYKSAGLDKACPTSLIVVTKRINTRLMYRHSNPPAGTVVDEAITLPEGHDFFLVSQNVSQGTVSPTCFHVIYNKMGISPDQLQLLTYKMCHNYLNWSGTVRVPSVCQYAHKLAFLVSESIQRIPSPGVSKHLYFL